jgi:hypothetical protein
MTHFWKILLISVVSLLIPVLSPAQKSYETSRVSGEKPEIDGLIRELLEFSAVVGDFIQREPLDGKAPSQQTTFAVIYDDDNIYVAIRAYDSVPSDIVTRLSRRDTPMVTGLESYSTVM